MSDYFYIQSRYYRSAETVLCLSRSRNIDIWSYGTILYEMLFGSPLFNAKHNNQLLKQIVQVIGFPPLEMIKKYNIRNYFDYYSDSCVNTNTYLDYEKRKHINSNILMLMLLQIISML